MGTLTIKQAKNILTVLKRMDSKAAMFTDYSGRFMYGSKCLGYVVSSPESVGAAVAIGLAGTEIDPLDLMNTAARDNMGLDFIVYFPETTVAG